MGEPNKDPIEMEQLDKVQQKPEYPADSTPIGTIEPTKETQEALHIGDDADGGLFAEKLKQLNLGEVIGEELKKAFLANAAEDTTKEEMLEAVREFRDTITLRVKQTLEIALGASKALTPVISLIAEEASEALQQWAALMEQANKDISAFTGSNTWSEIKEIFPDADQWLEAAQENNAPFTAEIISAFPDMLPELQQYASNQTEAGTLAALISEREIETSELDQDSPFQALIDAANTRLKKEHSITVKSRLDRLDFPLDKVNSKMWNLLETDAGTQLRFAVEKAGSKKQLNVIYSIDFEEAEQTGLRISKKLDAFDKRVYIAAASLYAYKVDTMTIGQIYSAMGYDGTPGAKDREKINNSLSKMQMAHIFIDNNEEADVYKYDHFRYDGYLLPLERVSRIVNGVFVDGVIHLLKEPPMYTFAKNRRQITTIQRSVLNTPLSKTNANLLLEDYLIERIAKAKGGKGHRKILYKTVYDNTGATTKVQRQRTRSRIAQLLEHYKSTNYIKGYTTSADGVCVDP